MSTKLSQQDSKQGVAKTHAQSRRLPDAQTRGLDARAALLLRLQRTHGNRFVKQSLQSEIIQAKLSVSQPDDQYEQEADRVAEQIMRMPEPDSSGQTSASRSIQRPSVQRVRAQRENRIDRQPEDDEEEVEILNAKSADDTAPEVSPELQRQLDSSRGGGQPLSQSARSYFEPRFGVGFNQVRIHTDGRAADMAKAVNARAFTMGRDIFFAAQEYAPSTQEGQRLLAHELTHVVQQGGAYLPAPQDDDRGVNAEPQSQTVARQTTHGLSKGVRSKTKPAVETTLTFEEEEGTTFQVETRWERVREFPRLPQERPHQGLVYLFVAVTSPEDISDNNIAAAQTARNTVLSNPAIFNLNADVVDVALVDSLEGFIRLFERYHALAQRRNLLVRQVEVFSHGGLDGPMFGPKKRQFGLDGAPPLSNLPRLPYTGDAVVFFRGCRIGAGRFLQNFAQQNGVATYGFEGTTSFSTHYGIFFPWRSGTPSYQLDFPGSETISDIFGRHPIATPPRGQAPRRGVVIQRKPQQPEISLGSNAQRHTLSPDLSARMALANLQRKEEVQPDAELASRIKKAQQRMRDREFASQLKEQVPRVYSDDPAGGTEAVVDFFWSGLLEMEGVSAAETSNRRQKQEVSSLRSKLQQLISRELVLFFKNAAKGLKARRAELEPLIIEQYKTLQASDTDKLTNEMWKGWLGFGAIEDLDASSRNQAKATWKALKKEIERAFVVYFQSTTEGLEARSAEIAAIINEKYRVQPSTYDMTDLTDRLWIDWLKFGRLKDLNENIRGHAVNTYKKLNDITVRAVKAYFESAEAPQAVAALNQNEKALVKAAILGSQTYLNSAPEMDALTDTTLAQIKGGAVTRDDADWKSLRQRITTLLIAAETEIIREFLPHDRKTGAPKFHVTEVSWGEARIYYLKKITKPVWLFYRDDIVGFSFLGSSTRKEEGVHKRVASALTMVEQSAARIAAAQSIDLSGVKLPCYGFRFEPKYAFEHQRPSFHDTGRAVDFAPSKANPMFQGPVEELISVLGVEELAELTIPRRELSKVAAEIQRLSNRRATLATQLAQLPQDSSDKERLEAEIAAVDNSLDTYIKSEAVQRHREQSAGIHEKIEAAEATFQEAWKDLTGESGKAEDVDLDELRASVTARLEPQRQLLDQLKAEVAALDERIKGMSDKEHRAEKQNAQKDLARLRDNHLLPVRERVKRLEELQNILEAPERLEAEGSRREKISAAQKKRGGLLQEAASIAKSGITNLPRWLIEAFTEQGWSWGGSWGASKDSMHFDYMGPVESVVTEESGGSSEE